MWSPPSDDDWKVHLYNQERMLSSQDRLIEAIDRMLANQQELARLAIKLNGHLDTLGAIMHESSKTTQGLVKGIIKVPIVIVIMGISSIAFYFKYIAEHTWLAIIAVAVFPYLGDSITAIAKLFGIGRGNQGNSLAAPPGGR
jgi:hypothetical protein